MSDNEEPRFMPTTSELIDKFRDNSKNTNTQKSDTWTRNTFCAWSTERGMGLSLTESPVDVLIDAISPFLIEARTKVKHEKYQSDTIYLLFCGLNRVLKERDPQINLFSKTDARSIKARQTCDGLMKHLQDTEPIKKKTAPTITEDQEREMWKKGVLGDKKDNILDTVIFLVGKYFLLRGGEELRNFRFTDLSFDSLSDDKMKITFTERRSKNHPGGIKRSKTAGKEGYHIEDPNMRYSLTRIIQKYINHLPTNYQNFDSFWFHLRKTATEDDENWFTNSTIGKTALSKVVKKMFEKSGIIGNFTNHSLRVAGVNALLDSNIVSDTQIVTAAGWNAPRSLQTYKRASNTGAKTISNVVSKPAQEASNESESNSEEKEVKNDEDLTDLLKDIEDLSDFEWDWQAEENEEKSLAEIQPTISGEQFNIGTTQLIGPDTSTTETKETQTDPISLDGNQDQNLVFNNCTVTIKYCKCNVRK